MKKRTTATAARAAKISRATLQEWIRAGKFKAPDVQLVGGKGVRLWGASDLKRLLAAKNKLYGQGKGKKKDGGR
jgi:predicted site-specific integrase-resolvase